jgi:two-component system NtrC family sensor kinase
MCVLLDAIDVLSEAPNQKMPLGKSFSNLAFIPMIPIRTELKTSNCVCVRISDQSQQLTVRVISCPVDYPTSGRGP